LTIIPCCSQILASSNPNRILHNLELLYAIMDQKWVADVGDSIDWLSVVVLKLANLSKKKKYNFTYTRQARRIYLGARLSHSSLHAMTR